MGQRANPGGVLAPDEVIGRDILVESLWRTLERQSLYITAERRMGKTSVVRDKMGKNPPAGWTLIYLDVSKAVTPLQFVEALVDASRNSLSKANSAKFQFMALLNNLGGAELKTGIGLKLPDTLGMHWKRLLETLLHDLSKLETRIVLAFDELTLMLDAIRRSRTTSKDAKSSSVSAENEAIVMELLDTLRAARQEHNLRMIYTGSLGLHHVLTGLREQGYQNSPTNDMKQIDLPPLADADAIQLARRLLDGEAIKCENDDGVARHLAIETNGVAYYIQHIVSELAYAGEQITEADIDNCIEERLGDPLDPWQLNYYDERIDTHYPVNYRPIARAILDHLALGEARTLQELLDGLDPRKTDGDIETMRRVTRLLGQDHYIHMDEIDKTKYCFRLGFIMRVWRSRRGF